MKSIRNILFFAYLTVSLSYPLPAIGNFSCNKDKDGNCTGCPAQNMKLSFDKKYCVIKPY